MNNKTSVGLSIGIVFFLVLSLSVASQVKWNRTVSEAVYVNNYFHDDDGAVFVISTAGAYENLTIFNMTISNGASVVNNSFITIDESGVYSGTLQLSFSDGGNKEFQLSVFVNDVVQENFESHRKVGTAGDVGSMSSTGILNLNEGDVVTVAMKSVSDPVTNPSIQSAQFQLHRIG